MKAEQLRKSILQLAIQGKLVPQDPNDEPASVLLERIRAEKQRLIKEGKIKKDKNDSVIFKGDDNRHYEKVGSEVKDITDDLPFEIPDSWVWTRLGKLITIISGVSYDKKDVSNKGIRILRGGNVNELKISIFLDDVFLPEKYYDADKQVRKNDVVIVASTGSKAVIGKAGFVDNDIFNTQIGAFLRIVRPIFDVIAPYLKMIFATKYYREHIRTQSQGTNINNVKAEYITDLRIPLPPLAEQARIVAEIEKFEPLIAEYDKLEQQATKLDEEIYDKLKKSILQYAIQGKLVPQEPNDEPASVLLERIRAEKKAKLGKKYVDSYIYKCDDNCYYEHIAARAQDEPVEVLFDIPENWAFTRLDTIIGLSSGTNLTSVTMAKSEQIYPVFGGNGITGYYDKYNIGADHIIIGRVGFYCGSIHVTNKKSWITDNALIVSFDNSSISTSFFALLLESLELGKKSSATAQPLVTGKIIKPIIVALPPLAEQNRIVAKINEIFAML